jgi:N-acetylmuramoyl-L-alanine amidase
MKLAIIVGHSIQEKGAWAVAPLNQSEYDYNLGVAEFAYRRAMSEGINCKIFLRKSPGKKGVKQAYDEVNKWADENTAAVELHFNSFNGKAYGTETWFDNEPIESVDLARKVHEQIVSVFKRTNKGNRLLKMIDINDNKYDRGEYNFAQCRAPMCLVEPFFGDNAEDADLGLKLKLLYADAIVYGVKDYFIQKEKNLSLN